MGFAPNTVVDGPPRLPLPFGLTSVVPLAEAVTERWENGVVWEPLSCDPAGVVVGDCDSPEGFPKQFPAGGAGTGKASAFTVYGVYKCDPIGHTLEWAQERAREHLFVNEEKAAETRLWRKMAQDPSAVTLPGGTRSVAVGQLEQWIAENYGSRGVIHASRNAATIIGRSSLASGQGSQLTTKLGTPIIAGGGYPGTGLGISEVQRITVTGSPTGGTFTLTFEGETTGPIAFNATAAQVQTALEALPDIEPGDVVATGGPLPGTAITLTFGGRYDGVDVPQVTTTSSFTGGTTPSATGGTTVTGSFTAPAAGTEWIAVSPAIFGYRSQPFESTNRPGDLLDRSHNDLYGIAERNYLLGYDPCGVAFAPLTLEG